MRRFGLEKFVLVVFAAGAGLGASPAASSYRGVEQKIGQIRQHWARPGASAQPNAAGWNALFDALLNDLRTYSGAAGERERLAALDRVYQISVALGGVGWAPAAELREGLREWLRPRVRLAWAERRLVDRVRTLPAADPAARTNHERWVRFVDNDLGQALRRYEAAPTVAQRVAALDAVYAALLALQTRNQASPWVPSVELEAALNDLYNRTNFDVSVDAATLSPVFNTNLVTSGPVYRKGYVSQVTAGPKTGFGLLPSDDGIAFYNSQMLSSVTPIWDFQQQIEKDPKGRRAAKLYRFGATSTDNSELTITVVLRPSGLSITPSYKHNVGADVSATPQERGKLGRAIASLVGFNQPRITQMVWENAIGPMAANVEKEAMEEGLERTSREAGVRNAALAQYLIGGDRATFRNLLIERLSLRSRPENALIGGKLEFVNAKGQVGADAPEPPSLSRPDAGVSADLHLSSIMTNFTRGYLQSPAVSAVENLLIVTHKEAATPPTVTRNADYPTFLRAVAAAQAANDPKEVAIRVKRPTAAPEFGADANGNLVALVRDFRIEVPVPPQVARGGLAGPPARVYRLTSPQTEFAISFRVTAKSETEPLRLTGRVEGFDPGPNARVYAINEDENQATPLNAFTAALVVGGFRTKIVGQPIDVPLSDVQLRGFAIRSVSPLDPSGWIRVNLDRTSPSPAAGLR